MRSKTLFYLFGMFAVVSVAACRDSKTFDYKHIDSECTALINGNEMFIGDAKCMSNLPRKNIDGYWIVDHEYSVLYSTMKQSHPIYDENAAWVNLSDGARSVSWPLIKSGRRQVFKVRFFGTRSDAPGLYGPGGFKRGVYIDHILSIREVYQ